MIDGRSKIAAVLLAWVLSGLGISSLADFSACAQEVVISEKDGEFDIRASGYTATVSSGGCLNSVNVKGQEFLMCTKDFSQGGFFFNGKIQQLAVEHPAGIARLSAKNENAELVYAFEGTRIGIDLVNRTDRDLNFRIVLPPDTDAVSDGHGQWAKPPVDRPWGTAVCCRSASSLKFAGITALYGPWKGRSQVLETILAPHATAALEIVAGDVSEDMAARVKSAGVRPVLPENDIQLVSPLDYQVFQRRTFHEGMLLLSGKVSVECDQLLFRLSGKSIGGEIATPWQALAPFDPATRQFNVRVPLAAGGWYALELEVRNKNQTVARAGVAHVGMGEVFVGAGQSNSTNYGGEGRLKTVSRMVSTFDGNGWRLADDPQPGVHDHSIAGSFWPAFGDALFERYRVPVGVAVTGNGGTSVRQWARSGPLYSWTIARIRQLGPEGFRALLWHQGESDVRTAAERYFQDLSEIIRGSKTDAGWEFPWFVAQASYFGPQATGSATVREGQRLLWERGVALPGPDTDTLTGANRDSVGQGVHFSRLGLEHHGRLWAEKVGAYLDRVGEMEKK